MGSPKDAFNGLTEVNAFALMLQESSDFSKKSIHILEILHKLGRANH